MLSGNTDERLSSARRSPSTLLPLLQRALGNTERSGELGLRRAGAVPCFDNLIERNFHHARDVASFHLANRLQQLALKLLTRGLLP